MAVLIACIPGLKMYTFSVRSGCLETLPPCRSICTAWTRFINSIRFNHKRTILHTEGWIGEWWNRKYALMLNVVITERRIVIQSIACVNNASAAPSHYALLMSKLLFILVHLSIYRNSSTGNESISFSSSFWSSCLLFWCRVSRDVFHRDYMYITQVINKSVIKLLSLLFAYV